MASVERFRLIQKRVEGLQRDHDRAEGVLDQMMGSLKESFDCISVLAGESLLDELEAGCDEKREKFANAMDRFEKRFGNRLGEQR